MKKWMTAASFLVVMAGCNDGLRSDEHNSDSTSVLVDNPSPVSDSSHRMNIKEGYPGDTSNRNGDDSIKGTSPNSRSTTPRNTTSQGSNRKQQ